MANEFTKPTSITPAVIGAIANPDEYNKNIAGQSKDSLVCIDADGSFTDGNIGDETLGLNGTLINDIKLREGGVLNFYNISGVFQNAVNLGQATTTLIGQSKLLTNALLAAATNSTDSATASSIASLFSASSLAINGTVSIPVKVGGVFVEVVLKWGTVSSTTDSDQTFTFPSAFPSNAYAAFAIGATGIGFSIPTLTTTQITLDRSNTIAGTNNVYYFVIGD